jgi:hypothetical protein
MVKMNLEGIPIWIEDPTATPIAKSILFLLATVTAVTCSAALPTIGRMINPMKASLSPEFPDTTELILSTMNSAQTATRPVEISNKRTAVVREMFSSSSSAAGIRSAMAVDAMRTG